jgi:hypothetical protein
MLGAHPDKCCLVRSFSRGDRLGNKSAVRNDQEPGTYMSYAPPQLAGSRRLGMPTVMERAARRWPIGLAASTRQRAIYAVICLLGQKLVNVKISLQQWRSHRITLHSGLCSTFHDCEHCTFRDRLCDLRIGAQCFGRSRLWQFLTLSYCVVDH